MDWVILIPLNGALLTQSWLTHKTLEGISINKGTKTKLSTKQNLFVQDNLFVTSYQVKRIQIFFGGVSRKCRHMNDCR